MIHLFSGDTPGYSIGINAHYAATGLRAAAANGAAVSALASVRSKAGVRSSHCPLRNSSFASEADSCSTGDPSGQAGGYCGAAGGWEISACG